MTPTPAPTPEKKNGETTMNKEQALVEARRRWGKYAYVKEFAKPRKLTGATKWVGHHMGGFFMVEGWGTTWEDAFEHSDLPPCTRGDLNHA